MNVSMDSEWPIVNCGYRELQYELQWRESTITWLSSRIKVELLESMTAVFIYNQNDCPPSTQ